MAEESVLNKSLIKIAEVVQLEDNLDTASKKEISRNSFGRRIKVKYFGDDPKLDINDLPWVFPLLPKHLQVIPKVGETVMVILQSLDSPNGNRFYIGPIISQDYYLDHGGHYEAQSLLQGESTTPLCHPSGSALNDGSYPKPDTVAIQGRGDSAIWLEEEGVKILCGHKPQWRNRSSVERADPGSLTFNKTNLGYIQMKYDTFKDSQGKDFHSVVNVVADRINLLTHDGADTKSEINLTDPEELTTKDSVEKITSEGQSMVCGDKLIEFLNTFREVFKEHTHHWMYDLQVTCEKDNDGFWNKDLQEILCKRIKIL